MELHERIRWIRKHKGITQTFVANEIKMKVSSYNMKENGKRPISTAELEQIALALKEPIVNFFDKNIHVKLNCESDTPGRKEVG